MRKKRSSTFESIHSMKFDANLSSPHAGAIDISLHDADPAGT